MIRNLKKLFKTHFLARSNSFSPIYNPAPYQMESMPHFYYENPENLTSYTNIPLIHNIDIQTFVKEIDTFIFDCDGVIVKSINLRKKLNI